MNNDEIKNNPVKNLYLEKWFLDFVGDNGEAMIFYAAKLKWHGWPASYTSWLRYDVPTGVSLKSRFRDIQIPQINDEQITWSDSKFDVSGTWTSKSNMIRARLFDSEDGFLDWNCYQPSSKVKLKINGTLLEGNGYAEQLILTAPPWKIPMDELQWGRFGSAENNMVWIELKEKETQQWLWLNGEKIENCTIKDDRILLNDLNLSLYLDRGVVLESEKKIFSVVEKLIRYIPGFNKVMPLNFLMADEFKWLSKGQLHAPGKTPESGMAIHELVNFKGKKS